MDQEFQAISSNHTWTLCDLPVGRKVIGSKWVFKKKTDRDKIKYKARLVAQGFTQVQGVDYVDTFSPVVRSSTIRILFSNAAEKNWIFFIMMWI